MNYNIALFGKIAARSFLSLFKIIAIGSLLSIVGLITSFILLGHHPGAGNAGSRAGFIGALLSLPGLFLVAFWATSLLIASLIGLFYYPSIASKYALQKALHLCWENKLGDYFVDKAGAYADRIFKRPAAGKATPVQDAPAIRKALQEEVKHDPGTNKLQKRIFRFLLRKVRLDDVNFSDPNLDIKMVVLKKIKEGISEKIEPSKTLFWIAFGLQAVLLVLAIIYDR